MRHQFLSIIYDDMKDLSSLVRETEYFTICGEFDRESFRKYQCKLYGKVELACDLDLITWKERKTLRNHIINIGKKYRLNHLR